MYVQLSARAFVNGREHEAGEVVQLDDAIDQEFGTVLTEDADSPQTAAQWTSDNPTLADNTFGVESDTGKIKVGTGAIAWVSLEYAVGTFTADPETLSDKLGKDLTKLPLEDDGDNVTEVDTSLVYIYVDAGEGNMVPTAISLTEFAQIITTIQTP